VYSSSTTMSIAEKHCERSFCKREWLSGLPKSGSEALKLADDFTPAVIITALSGQDTLDLARQIRRQKSIGHRVSFIALTTLPDAEFRAKAPSAGFDVCLVKPVPPGALLSAIAQTPR
jgi:DNA-binding response OmpR family regulator